MEVSWHKHSIKHNNHPILKLAMKQLEEYFEGKRERFDLPLEMNASSFQKCIWKTLQDIPYGETIGYAELAKKAGFQKAFRAVGSACGQNPLPIIIPCHRVISSDGSLGGFSGKLAIKKFLLNLEGKKIKFIQTLRKPLNSLAK